jgi:endonuclease/exonuclease/phosphatase family metal-dependent hydrolase
MPSKESSGADRREKSLSRRCPDHRLLLLLMVALAVPASGLPSPAQTSAAASGRLRIVSANIQVRTDAAPIAEEWRRRGLHEADIYLLQEVIGQDEQTSRVAEELAASRGLRVSYRSALALAPGRMYGLAILSKYPLRDLHTIPLKRYDLNVRSRVRIALAATAETELGPVRLVNVHLDTRIDLEQRLAQLAPVIEHAEAQPWPVILGGDLNTNPHRWLFHLIPIPFAQNQVKGLLRHVEAKGFDSAIPASQATHDVLGMRLDWILLKGLETEQAAVVPVRQSDHHALQIQVSRQTESADEFRSSTVPRGAEIRREQ